MSSGRRLAAIMFTDLVGSTAAAQRDEKGALRRLVDQERLLRPIFVAHAGREVKSTGDGFLVEFDSALHATECAVEAQRALREWSSREPHDPMTVRIGIHLGDVEHRDGDIFGDAVNVAARLEPLADAGGVCVSGAIFGQIHDKVPYRLEKLEPRQVKGLREPLEAYRLVLPWANPTAAGDGAHLPRLAVLPFSNISPDPDNEFFADGLTEEIITVLSQIKGLRVISRTSVNQYKGTHKSVAQIGQELGADSILEGSVRRAGDQLRIAVQLIDTRSDEHRWAKSYDRKLENLFAIQTDVAEQTAGALKVELLRPERDALHERPTANLLAYESYLRGIQASKDFSGATAGDWIQMSSRTIKFFENAIQQDPGFGAAYARLAVHLTEMMGEIYSRVDVAPRIRDLVARALELSPHSAEAHAALGSVLMQVDHDWVRAEAEFQQAIALNPSSSLARQTYAFLLRVVQRFGEAEKQDLVAIEQDPLSFVPRWAIAMAPVEQGDIETSILRLEELVEKNPERTGCRSVLATLCTLAGRKDQARGLIAPWAGKTDQLLREFHAFNMAVLGEPAEAIAFLADWEGGRLPERYPLPYAASLCCAMGDDERGLALLERDLREGDKALWAIYRFPMFDRLRGNPRFLAMLDALKLPKTIPRPLLFQ